MTTEMTDLLFFYGTLMNGHGRHGIHGRYGVEFVGPAKIRGDLISVGDSFPGFITGEGEIVGEVWRLPADPARRRAAIGVYDSIEGYHEDAHDGMYLREIHSTLDGQRVSVYRWNRGIGRYETPIPSGDWAAYDKTVERAWQRSHAEPVEVDPSEFDWPEAAA